MKAVNFWKTLFCAALAITAFSACSDDDNDDDGGIPSITVDGKESATLAVKLEGGTTEAVEVVSTGNWVLELSGTETGWCHPSKETGGKGKTSLTFTVDKWEGAASTDERSVTATLTTNGSFEGIPIPKKATIIVKQNGDGSTAVTTNVAEVRKLLEAIGQAGPVTDEVAKMTLTGIVVSDAAGSNAASGGSAPYYIVVQDNSTAAGSGLMLNANKFKDLALAPGDVVSMPLTGAEISYFNKVLQVKISNDVAIETSKTDAISPVTITADKIVEYESMLVKIENCQPAIDFVGTAWYNNSASGVKGNTTFEVLPGKATTFIVRTGSAAAFKDAKIPEKSGSVIGIATQNNGTGQVMPRMASDLSGLDKDYSGPTYNTGTISQIKVGEYWEITATIAALYTRGFLLADDSGYTLVYNAAWTSQTSNTYQINQKVTIKGKVEMFPADNGLLQFNSPEIKDAGTGSFTPATATEFNAAALTAYESDMKYMPVTLTGVLSITEGESGGVKYNSYTVAVAGYDSRVVTLAYAFDKDFTTLAAGDVVDITGFAIGTNFDKSAINIMVKTIAKNTTKAAVAITGTPTVFVADGENQPIAFMVSNAGNNKVYAKIVDDATSQFSVPTGVITSPVTVTAKANADASTKTAKLVIYLAASEGGEAVASDEIVLTQAGKISGDAKYVKVTALTAGKKYLIVGDSGDKKYLFDPAKFSNGKVNGTEITVSNDEIAATEANNACAVTIASSGEYYTIQLVDNRYVEWDSGTNLKLSDSSTKTWTAESVASNGTILFKDVSQLSASTPRAFLFQIKSGATVYNRFGGYAVSNANNGDYVSLSLYQLSE